MHTVVKFTNGHENPESEDSNLSKWHLLSEAGSGEYTACGLAEPDYENIQRQKEKGGITCPACLDTIRYYKTIKI